MTTVSFYVKSITEGKVIGKQSYKIKYNKITEPKPIFDLGSFCVIFDRETVFRSYGKAQERGERFSISIWVQNIVAAVAIWSI